MRPRYSVGTKSLAPSRSGSKVSPRDLYNRGSATPAPRAGTRPVTSSRVVDRYRNRVQPKGDGRGAARRTPADRVSPTKRDGTGPTRSTPRTGAGPGVRGAAPGTPSSVRGTASHRYRQPNRGQGGRVGVGSSNPNVLGGGNRGGSRGGTLQPGLRRPTAVAPAALGTRTAPRVSAPRLNPRRGSYGGYGYGYRAGRFGYGYGYGGYGGLYFGISFGLGYGLYSSGYYCYPYFYGAYWPYRYYRHCYSYGLYGYYRPYCYPSYYNYCSYWWWPRYCYLPSYRYTSYYPSTVYVTSTSYGDDYSGEEIVVDSRPAPAGAESMAALAEKYVNLGDFYFKEGRFQEAADAYARARTYAPNDASIHFVLADALFAIGDYHFAAYLINEAIRLDPDIARADTDKRLFYSDVKVFEEHMQTLLKYLEDRPYDAMAHLVLGYNLKFSGKSAEAKLAFQKVLEIEPGNQAAQAFLTAIEKPEEPIVLETAEKAAGDKK